MKRSYQLIINGHLQECIYPFDNLERAISYVKELRQDGRIKENDEVKIRQTIVIEELV